jgi:hypothetical protein
VRYANFPLVLNKCAAFKSRWARTVKTRFTLFGRAAVVLALGVLFSTTNGVCAAEASSPLSGQWQAAETANEKIDRLKAIDEATARLGGFQQGMARRHLSERTSPPRSLIIEIEGSKVTIGSGDRRLELELGGSPIEALGSQGKAQVSANMQGPMLIVMAQSDKGERTTAYRASGDRLTVEVTMTGDRLAGPLKYVSTYVRTN